VKTRLWIACETVDIVARLPSTTPTPYIGVVWRWWTWGWFLTVEEFTVVEWLSGCVWHIGN